MGGGASSTKYVAPSNDQSALLKMSNEDVWKNLAHEVPGNPFKFTDKYNKIINRDHIMNTLITLVAAASWDDHAADGAVQVRKRSPQQDGGHSFCIKVVPADPDTVVKAIKAKVEQFIEAQVPLDIGEVKKEAAFKFCQDNGFLLSAALVNSISSPVVCMHQVHVSDKKIFQTPATCPLAPMCSLRGINWDISHDPTGGEANHFVLVGPSVPGFLGTPSPGFHKRPEHQAILAEVNAEAAATSRQAFQKQAEQHKLDDFKKLVEKIGDNRFIVVSGPSSSGKTTFAHRLQDQLKSGGKISRVIEVDNYYKARSDPTHPRDWKGELNFEVVHALRLQKLATDLKALLDGETVELPSFDFKTGEFNDNSGEFLQLEPGTVLIMEGIFGLHTAFQESLKMPCFKILIGPYSGLQVDDLYIVSEKVIRTFRRCGRDTAHRGVSPEHVLHKVYSVARGEQDSIFPFAKDADFIFDTALPYEASALKESLLKPLLGMPATISTTQSMRGVELLGIFSWVQTWVNVAVPKDSILSEFVPEKCLVDEL